MVEGVLELNERIRQIAVQEGVVLADVCALSRAGYPSALRARR